MSAVIRQLMQSKRYRQHQARGVQNAGDAYSDAITAAIGGTSSDAKTLGGAATGAATGAEVGGIWGAIIGFIGGAIAGGGGAATPGWLDPALIGNFAYATIVVGAQRLLPPWDIGAGLINLPGPPPTHNDQATINIEATNLVKEMLMSRRDLCYVAPNGDMAPEIEAACFLFAQMTGAWDQYPDPVTAWQAFQSAPTWDLKTFGNDLKQAIRWQMQQIIVNLPAAQKAVVSQAAQQARIGSATYVIPHRAITSAATSKAAIAAATARVRPTVTTNKVASATKSIAVPLGIVAGLAVLAAVTL